MDSDPEKSFNLAKQAHDLGDPVSASLQSQLLDHYGADHSLAMGKDRVRIISQLVSKLDPVFSFNIISYEKLKLLGFIPFLIGIELKINLYYLYYPYFVYR